LIDKKFQLKNDKGKANNNYNYKNEDQSQILRDEIEKKIFKTKYI
jgi:hypothetical protein